MPDVVAFDDEFEILEALRDFLGGTGVSLQMELVEGSLSRERSLATLQAAQPKVVVTDWVGIGEAVLEAVELLDTRPKVMVFSSRLDLARESPRAGFVVAFVEKPPENWGSFAQQVVSLATAPEGSP